MDGQNITGNIFWKSEVQLWRHIQSMPLELFYILCWPITIPTRYAGFLFLKIVRENQLYRISSACLSAGKKPIFPGACHHSGDYRRKQTDQHFRSAGWGMMSFISFDQSYDTFFFPPHSHYHLSPFSSTSSLTWKNESPWFPLILSYMHSHSVCLQTFQEVAGVVGVSDGQSVF